MQGWGGVIPSTSISALKFVCSGLWGIMEGSSVWGREDGHAGRALPSWVNEWAAFCRSEGSQSTIYQWMVLWLCPRVSSCERVLADRICPTSGAELLREDWIPSQSMSAWCRRG